MLPATENTYPTSLFWTKFAHQYDYSLLLPGWIWACGWIGGAMVHKSHPQAPIHPDLCAAGRLTMHACTKATIKTHALGAACDAGVEEPGADGGGVVSHDDDVLALGEVVGLGGALELGGGVMVAGGVLGGGT